MVMLPFASCLTPCENPFDTNGLSARWELDKVPSLFLPDFIALIYRPCQVV